MKSEERQCTVPDPQLPLQGGREEARFAGFLCPPAERSLSTPCSAQMGLQPSQEKWLKNKNAETGEIKRQL